MKKLRWITMMLLALVLVSCNGEATFETKTFEGKYSMDIPDYMESLTLGNSDASMEYGNLLKEHYVIVIAETREELLNVGLDYSIEDYASFSIDYLKQSLTNSKAQRMHEEIQNINGLEAISYKVWGIFPDNNEDIFYYMTIFKSEDNYYSMSTWTLGSREKIYVGNMEKMINSFKEI